MTRKLSRHPVPERTALPHPASRRTPPLIEAMPTYDHEGELAALLSNNVKKELAKNNIVLTSYSQ